jgi:hypothetical protein
MKHYARHNILGDKPLYDYKPRFDLDVKWGNRYY